MTNLPANLSNIPGTVGNQSSTDSAFTNRLQLLQPLSTVLTNWDSVAGPTPKPGDFFVGPPSRYTMGTQMHVIPIDSRDHAMQMQGQTVALESFVCPPRGSPPKSQDEQIFARIQNAPKQEEVDKKRATNMWGRDVLLWVPKLKKFAIYFLHSTARPESENAMAYRGKCLVVRSKKVETPSYKWWTPEFLDPKATPPVDPSDANLPDDVALVEEVAKFRNPTPGGIRGNNDGIDGRPR